MEYSRNRRASLSKKQLTHVERGEGPRSLQWLTILLFLWLSSLAFCWFFEWQRYQIIGGPRVQAMSAAGKILLMWVLMAKSLCWFLPILPLWALLVSMQFWSATAITLMIFWIVMFYFMGLDLVSVGFAGYHLWDYLPNVEDYWRYPNMKVWQWAGGQLTAQALSVFLVVTSAGLFLFHASKKATMALGRRHVRLASAPAVVFVTSWFVLFVLGPVPIGGCLSERVLAALPVSENMKGVLGNCAKEFGPSVGLVKVPVIPAELIRFGEASATSVRRIAHGKLGDGKERLHLKCDTDTAIVGATDGPHSQTALGAGELVTPDDEVRLSEVLKDSVEPAPVDVSAYVSGQRLPNIILIIFESFRYSALGPELMKALDAWAQQGLRLNRHYSGSNCSHLGLFSLFYARIPLGYHETLNRHVPAQMFESLRRSGYEITFLTAGETQGFRRLDEFINKGACDNFVTQGEFAADSMDDWPNSDRRKLARVRQIVNELQARPQFVFLYLISSHYRYAFPPDFAFHKEVSYFWNVLNPSSQIQNLESRYANSMLFLEHEVLKLARSIDSNSNIIIITGDHGESMGEDGVFTHGSRMSEIQMRVPFVMVGPGVEPRKMSTATAHYDVLPTLLHALAGQHVCVKHCNGRDLIAQASPADEVIVVPANGPDWDRIMLIRGDKRLLFRPANDSHSDKNPVMKFDGMVDEVGDYYLKVSTRQDSQNNQ